MFNNTNQNGNRKEIQMQVVNNPVMFSLVVSDNANLDEGAMWPVAFALEELSAAEEAKVGAPVKKAVG